jgi:hypothetical protein
VLEHLAAVDFEALAELNGGFVDELFQQRFRSTKGSFRRS